MEFFNKTELVEFVDSVKLQQEQNNTQKRQERVFAYVDEIFKELKAIAPVSFRLATEDSEAELKAVWADEFINGKTKITPKMINGALNIARLQEEPFMPTLGKFIRWCKQAQQEQLNIIKPHELIDLMKRFSASRGLDNHHKFNYGSDLNYWLVHELYKGVIADDLNAKQAEQLASDLINNAVDRLVSGWQPQKQVTAIEEKTTYTPSANPLEHIQKIKQQMGLIA